MAILVANNAASTLDASITGASGTLTVQAGHGVRFPQPGADEYFIITVQEGSAFEIMRCTARNTDVLTVTRGQEGTLAQSFGDDSEVSMRITAGVMEAVLDQAEAATAEAAAALAAAEAAQETADEAVVAAGAASTTRLPLSGGTLTGNLVVSKSNPAIDLRKQVVGEDALVRGYSGSTLRWAMNFAAAGAEGGANAGADFSLKHYADDGTTLVGTAFSISRATGKMTIGAGGLDVGVAGILTTGPVVGASIVRATNTSAGYSTLTAGDPSNPGFIAFHTVDGIRRGYIGYGDGANRLEIRAENGWSWHVAGTVLFDNSPVFASGLVNVWAVGAGNAHYYMSDNAGTDRAVMWADASSHLNFRSGGASGKSMQLHAGGILIPPPTNVTSTSSVDAPVRVRNISGTGDTNLAAIGFECQGNYLSNMHLRADGVFGMGGGSASAYRWYANLANGDFTAAGNVSAYSDPRLKDDIQPILNPLGILGALNGVHFVWNGHSKLVGQPAGSPDVGVLADEVERVLPQAVSESVADEETGESYKLVAYNKLIPVLIEAVKALHARVLELEAR
jgi:hypothetical protein